jgi:hypothetical protein
MAISGQRDKSLGKFMEQHSDTKCSLESQLRELYGRAAYTHKTHEKMADIYNSRFKFVKLSEIWLSALSTGSLLLAILGDSKSATVIGAVFSTLLLVISLYTKEGSLLKQAQTHSAVGSKLWGVRENLLSLLVDMHDGRSVQEIRAARDSLNEKLENIYRSSPRTNKKAYAAAQLALKSDEELFFTDDELDKMLPKKLRVSK